MNLVQRSITSATWNAVANWSTMLILFARTILLSQLLPVRIFGIYALATSWVRLSAVLPSFGMGAAFIHRSEETEDEEEAAAVHFTLKLLFTIIWAAALIAGALLWTSGPLRVALIWLTLTIGGIEAAQTPRLLLTRRVVHQRLAGQQVVNTVATTAVALYLAWRGAGLYALLATDLVALIVTYVTFYGWRAVWRPRLRWSPRIIRYFLSFGRRSMLAEGLLQALNRIDDIWTGFFLGDTSLGYYSRAYTFATYPSQILASPLNAVAGGTYAELKKDALRLSRAFFRTNAFLIRSGFLLAAILALIAPEFIRLGPGAKWLPMLTAFRLMLVFTLLDPIKVTVANLFIAVGKPEMVVRARLLQLVALVAGLFLLGNLWGISGVAVAVDFMLICGIGLLLWQARRYVSYSIKALFTAPLIALAFGLAVTAGILSLSGPLTNDWISAGVKTATFSVVYGGLLLLLERKRARKLLAFVQQNMLARDTSTDAS